MAGSDHSPFDVMFGIDMETDIGSFTDRYEGLEKGTPRLLEVNPNPGWCWDGHLAKMSGHAGQSYSQMLGSILRSAELRLGLEPEDDQAAAAGQTAGSAVGGRRN